MEIRTEWIMPGTGAIAAAVTALVFGGFWLGLRRHRLKKKNGAGGWLNALGFGVLPGLMVWKTFEQYLDTGSA